MKIFVAKTVNSLRDEIHAVIDQIMMGEAPPHRAKAVLDYVKAQSDMVEANRRLMAAESRMKSNFGLDMVEAESVY